MRRVNAAKYVVDPDGVDAMPIADSRRAPTSSTAVARASTSALTAPPRCAARRVSPIIAALAPEPMPRSAPSTTSVGPDTL